MLDLNKERELCNQSFEKYWDDFCEAYGNGFDRSLAKLFFANGWGEAKAQAVPEKKIYLTCEQLYAAANFGAPNKDPELLETELTIAWFEEAHSGSGYYVYISEYPEEGAMKLESELGAEG